MEMKSRIIQNMILWIISMSAVLLIWACHQFEKRESLFFVSLYSETYFNAPFS